MIYLFLIKIIIISNNITLIRFVLLQLIRKLLYSYYKICYLLGNISFFKLSQYFPLNTINKNKYF